MELNFLREEVRKLKSVVGVNLFILIFYRKMTMLDQARKIPKKNLKRRKKSANSSLSLRSL
jgi:hypothetical protein